MYNSMASSQEAGSQGSTRLHMDMADAINVMLYASDCADGSPGYAVWDLFHAEDSEKIREFLRKKLTPSPTATKGQQESQSQDEKAVLPIQGITADHDPIHIQRFYLDVELRWQLWAQYGVKSYRIYQRPGEGVFIPAGCAHQVCSNFLFFKETKRTTNILLYPGCEYCRLYQDRS
jgi:lysine-specific demethylase 3